MAPSQLSGIRMSNLLFWLILGLLAVVYSTPVPAEDEVIREAATEGFLIDHFASPLSTIEPSQLNTFVPDTQELSSDSTHNDVIEGSGFAPSRFHEDATTTDEAKPGASSSSKAVFTRPKVPVPFSRSKGSDEASGSKGRGLESEEGSGTFYSVSITPEAFIEVKEVNLLHNVGPVNPPASPKGQGTPGWIIIVGFIVGVGALVMLCVAIATRDKWNGPRQASTPETNTNSTNQQRELEMETFLHKDQPRENGKAAEYTVIPLDELPEKYSSH